MAPSQDTFGSEKKKLDKNSHGKKMDFKLREANPIHESDTREDEPLVVPPLKNETFNND